MADKGFGFGFGFGNLRPLAKRLLFKVLNTDTGKGTYAKRVIGEDNMK